MTKNIMSIAAAAAIITSGASAFETNVDGNITNIDGVKGAYTVTGAITASPTALDVSLGKIGDALIFPAFSGKDGWESEIVVRNNKDYAVLAKFVAYSAVDSQELRDFNIYLSANDVFRCTIKDGLITTTDDSVNIGAGWGVFENVTIPEDTGYIVVYGMGEMIANKIHTPQGAAMTPAINPKQVLKDAYFHTLTTTRAGWVENTMLSGVYVDLDANITLPKVAADGNLTDVSADALSGTVRIANANVEARDLLRPATAITNYTDGFIMMWSPNELAAWADRNLGVNTVGVAGYVSADVLRDAATYDILKTWYTFNNATVDASDSTDLENKLVVTQPQKRTLVQLGLGRTYWVEDINADCKEKGAFAVETGATWAAVYGAQIWDEFEGNDVAEADAELSPGNSTSAQSMCNEVGEIVNVEADAEQVDFSEKNGYATLTFTNKSIPAIITQMSASQVGDSRRINWISAPAE